MLIVTQKKRGTRNVYYLTTTNSAGVPIRKVTYDCRIMVSKKDNVKCIYLLDRLGNVRKDPQIYLNEFCAAENYSTRMQRALALNLLYLFTDLYAKDPKEMTRSDVRELMNFMLGISVQPDEGGNRTLRNPKTVNTYYSFIKKYIMDRGWNSSAFMDTTAYRTETTIGDVRYNVRHYKDANTMRVSPLKNTMPPKHLNLEQATRLVDEVLKDKDPVMYILVRLQMGYGLRCGEALGITMEDIKKRNDKYYIILRNRCSDKPWQHCKTLYHPRSIEEYDKDVYTSMETGKIFIEKSFYDRIMDYIEKSWNESMPQKWRKRMEEDTRADNVESPKHKDWKPNRYIFIGKNKRLLSAQTYNYRLKQLFKRIGIPVDEGQKQTNCSHRLRHTFAMILTTYGKDKATSVQLKSLMRHHSVLSGQAYYTPTEEETANMRKDFIQSIQELIPGLSESPTNSKE